MVVAALGSVVPGGLAPLAIGIKALYGVANNLNDFLDHHIEEVKAQPNVVIARTGRVLEAAKYGFGLGYISSTIVIAAGQILLGNTFAALTTVATAVSVTNPIAMTCAAVGAVYYGWSALSDRERNEILETLSSGLQVGFELLKSVLGFVIEKTKELLSSKNIEEMKRFISEGAAAFGRTLGSVTHRLGDMAGDAFDAARYTAGEALGKTADVASGAYVAVTDGAVVVAHKVRARIVGEELEEVPAQPTFVPMIDVGHVRHAVPTEIERGAEVAARGRGLNRGKK